ncbi:MAG: hypothetical protein HY291_23350 [Planctomycetes bacterium]|nr:hypothetical protein [Planctomycetota bacterium]
MGDDGRTVHIRLSPRLQARLERLHAQNFSGLPIATVAKLLLADQLLKDETEQVAIMQRLINTPTDEGPAHKNSERLAGMNTNKRKSRR